MLHFVKRDLSIVYCLLSTVNHDILINKLNYYGIRGPALSWLTSYLHGRQQCVNIDGTKSNLCKIKHGVPQGSILGPLLFLIYINDKVYSSKKLKFLLFADDTSLFLTGNNKDEMQTVLNAELTKVSEWLRANKLSLNIGKSKVLDFSKKHNPESPLVAKIDSKQIELTECAKYLGILIDNRLTYKNHASLVSKRMNKGNSILYKLRNFIPEKDIRNVFYAHVHSHINYGIGAWGGATEGTFSKITKKQKKSLSITFFKNKAKIQNANILTPVQLKNINWCKKIWRINHNCTLSLDWLSENISINPRDNGKYLVPYKNTLFGRKSIFSQGIKFWNKIPLNIKQLGTLNGFCKALKIHISLQN